MDVLGDILATFELESSLYFRAELSAPYAIAVPEDRAVIRFHVANEGPCLIRVASDHHVRAEAGDLVLIPHGAAHVLADSDDTPSTALQQVIEQAAFDGSGPLVFGGGGRRTVLVCGCFSFGSDQLHPVVATLPPLLHVRGRGAHRYAWLEEMLRYMDAEASGQAAGWKEIVRRLSEVLLIQVLREYMGSSPSSTGALMALADDQLGRVLRAIHQEPAGQWSLDQLARLAGMSRTVFADRFRDGLGVTPLRYVGLWRMHKARALLARTRCNIPAVAEAVGFSSDAAFSRAFKEYFGASPGQYRREQEEP